MRSAPANSTANCSHHPYILLTAADTPTIAQLFLMQLCSQCDRIHDVISDIQFNMVPGSPRSIPYKVCVWWRVVGVLDWTASKLSHMQSGYQAKLTFFARVPPPSFPLHTRSRLRPFLETTREIVSPFPHCDGFWIGLTLRCRVRSQYSNVLQW